MTVYLKSPLKQRQSFLLNEFVVVRGEDCCLSQETHLCGFDSGSIAGNPTKQQSFEGREEGR